MYEQARNEGREKRVARILTDSSLGSRVDEGFDRVAIDFDLDIKHGHPSKGLWIVFQRRFQIRRYVLQPDSFLDPGLCIHVKRICIQGLLKYKSKRQQRKFSQYC